MKKVTRAKRKSKGGKPLPRLTCSMPRRMDQISRDFNIDIHSSKTYGWSVYIRSGIGSQCVAKGNGKKLTTAMKRAWDDYKSNTD